MSEATLDDMREMLADEAGLVTVATIRDNGHPLLSIVNAGVMDHPVSGEPVIAFVSGGSAVRLTHLRKRPHLDVLVRRGWRWAAASGDAELIGPDDQPQKLSGTDHDIASLMDRRVTLEDGQIVEG